MKNNSIVQLANGKEYILVKISGNIDSPIADVIDKNVKQFCCIPLSVADKSSLFKERIKFSLLVPTEHINSFWGQFAGLDSTLDISSPAISILCGVMVLFGFMSLAIIILRKLFPNSFISNESTNPYIFIAMCILLCIYIAYKTLQFSLHEKSN